MNILNKIRNDDLKRSLLNNEALNPVLIVRALEEAAKNTDEDEMVSLSVILRGDYQDIIIKLMRDLSERYFANKRRTIRKEDPTKDEIVLSYGFINRTFTRIEGGLYESGETYYTNDRAVSGKVLREIVDQLLHCEGRRAS